MKLKTLYGIIFVLALVLSAGFAAAEDIEILAGDITTDLTLTSDTVWQLSGLVVVTNNAVLTIEPGTTIIGESGTGANTSYMIIDKGAKIIADGTAANPIIFTSEIAYNGGAEAPGQWGGLTIIGNAADVGVPAGEEQVKPYEVNTDFVPGSTNAADDSGTLRYVEILNSGITMEQDKEINGLSLVGVGRGTTIDHVTVKRSDDDGIEIWGGTVDLSNCWVEYCTDDQFDIDDGYSGTVTNLTIMQHTDGNAGIEMSGSTDATFVGLTLTQNYSDKEGAIFFKKDGIGGHFEDCEIIDNVDDGVTIYSQGDADEANISFTNVSITSPNVLTNFVDADGGGSAADIEAKFDAGGGNTETGGVIFPQQTLAGDITMDMTLTADTVWVLDGLVAVKNGAVLTIEPGTTIIGKSGTGANTSYLVVDKGCQIIADGTAANPIIFTSEIAYNGGAEAPGQWGGLTIIGNAADVGVPAGEEQVKPYEVNTDFVPGSTNAADDSGTLRYVEILNSGITMEQDKEINGLSLVGVGSGTTIDHVTVKRSDDDGIEIWGGTVNLTNCWVEYCTDDQFDIDDGYSGTVTDLTIMQHTDGNAGIEMSGSTAATFIGLSLTQDYSDKEGAIFFKKDGIGGTFIDCEIIDNVDDGQTIYSQGDADEANISFTNVSITSPDAVTNFVDADAGGSAADIEAKFDAGTGNSENGDTNLKEQTLAGDITMDMTLTADTVWVLDGLVAVKNGAVLTIEPGTTIIGKSGTGANTSYLVVDKGCQIIADGTAANPIIFTSEIAYNGGAEAPGQWGGLTIIGNAADVGVPAGEEQVKPYEVNTDFVPGSSNAADDSGTLRYVEILNSGITMEQDKEINGLSLVGVGSGTTIDHVTVKRSDDDGIEIWGGTVNLTNCWVEYCTDDQFDIDDGYSGTVTDLTIMQHTDGNAGIEMSGSTAATFIGLSLTQDYSDKEGAIFFKKDGIGGTFIDCEIIDNVDDGQTIYSQGDADEANISFTNVSITSPDTATNFVNADAGGSAADIEAKFDAGTGNTENDGSGATGPAKPTGVDATDGTLADRIMVTWNAVNGATSYDVYRANLPAWAGGMPTRIATSVTVTSYEDTTAASGNQYYYWVKSRNAQGVSIFSMFDAGYYGAVGTAPARPMVTATDGTMTDKVTISWNVVDNTLVYDVFRAPIPAFFGFDLGIKPVRIASVEGLTYDDTTAVDGNRYCYWVKSRNSWGPSLYSRFDTGYVGAAQNPPAAPANVMATDDLSGKVTVTWDASEGAIIYEIWRALKPASQGGTPVMVGKTNNTVLTFDDTTAVAGTTYYYWAKAQDSWGSSAYGKFDTGVAGQ